MKKQQFVLFTKKNASICFSDCDSLEDAKKQAKQEDN